MHTLAHNIVSTKAAGNEIVGPFQVHEMPALYPVLLETLRLLQAKSEPCFCLLSGV